MSMTASAVAAWEDCQGRTHSQVAVRFLQLAHPDVLEDQLVGLSVGARDRLLLDLHDELFGSTIELRSSCPSCDERLEISATTDELRLPFDRDRAVREMAVDCYDVKYQLPSSADVAIASRAPDADERYRELWRRCISARLEGADVEPDLVPAHVRAEVEARMADLDSQAVSSFALECPVCSFRWDADFAIVPVLWAQLDGLVRRRLHDVHRLAVAYGWDESTVLALGPARRQFYLELL